VTYENRDDYYTWSWIEEYPGSSDLGVCGLVRAAIIRWRRRAKRTGLRGVKAD
jgi:hypothetical protein